MKREENVYEENGMGTEDIATAETDAAKGERKTASAVPEKFKDVDALVRAYGSLQAEFTRRSQRLKDLEREVDNLKRGADGLGAEKLKKQAEKRKVAEREFDDFVSELEAATRERPTKQPEDEQTGESEAFEGEEKTVGKGRAETKNSANADASASEGETTLENAVDSGREIAELSGEELYQRVCKDENVRLRVIGEYLNSIGRAGAPLMRGGVGTLATPPKRAKTVAEAGSMALRFFKNDGTQA